MTFIFVFFSINVHMDETNSDAFSSRLNCSRSKRTEKKNVDEFEVNEAMQLLLSRRNINNQRFFIASPP